MAWGWIILFGVGGLIGAVLLIFVVIPAIGDVIRSEKHATAWLKLHENKMPDKLFKDARKVLLDRAAPPYWELDSYGTDRHYIYALAAFWNHRRTINQGFIGGFHDQLAYVDARKGPVLQSDLKVLQSGLEAERIKDASQLLVTIENNLNGATYAENAQSIHLAGLSATPIDAENPDHDLTYLSDPIDPPIARQKAEHPEPLDLRTWRLALTVHLIRTGATLDWLDEVEADRLIALCARELLPRACRYENWQAYAKMMRACNHQMRYAGDAGHQREFVSACDALLAERHSPWNLLAIHKTDAQKVFAQTVPPHNPKLLSYVPQTFIAKVPEAETGDWVGLADRIISDTSGELSEQVCQEDLLKHLSVETMKELLSAHPEHPGICLLASNFYFLLGYDARGTTTADLVSNDQFTALDHCCAIAVRHGARGHDLAPEHPAMVTAMLRALPHVFSEDTGENYARAHKLANTVFLDNFPCQWAIANHRIEKWGGGTNEAFDFARDRMARSDNPMMPLLFVFAAVEYIENPFVCGFSHDEWLERLKTEWLETETRAAIDLLLPHIKPKDALAQGYCLWWAYRKQAHDITFSIGPDAAWERLLHAGWTYRTSTDVHLTLTWLRDIAVAGHPDWKEATSADRPAMVH